MAESERPIYVSRPWSGSRGQEYRVYRDRVELWSKTIVTMFTIPVLRIRRVRTVPPGFMRTLGLILRGEQPLLSVVLVARLDRAYSRRHVLLEVDHGFVRYYRFTPDDPAGFAAACERAIGMCAP